MATEKKNQHYVPKFYLRNFSFQKNNKQIGLYNLNNGIYFQKSKLKTQGSRNFFYGNDGEIEDKLALIEDKLAYILKNIIESKAVPAKYTLEHFDLLYFITLTDLRNPVRIDGFKDMLEEIRRRAIEVAPKTDLEKLIQIPSQVEMAKISLSHALGMGEMMLDLDYKLLINKTIFPFITSDFPIVKYNQFLEQKKWPFSKVGYGLVGLQIFIPLNHEMVLVFYDNRIYKLGDRKKDFYLVTDTKSVESINILQFLNCIETIFFDEKASESYILNINQKSKKYNKANQTRSELSYLIKEGDEENRKLVESGFKNFIRNYKTDCEIDLQIEGLSIHSKGKEYQLNDSLSQLRPHAERLKSKFK